TQNYHNITNEINKVKNSLEKSLNQSVNKIFDMSDWKYKPFNWCLEFPEVFFKNNGYDVIVGNPPYIRVHKQDSQLKSYLRKNFMTPKMDFDIYVCFFELGLKLLKKSGILSFIVPDKFLLREYAENLRVLLLNNTNIIELLDISRCNVFKASTYPIIITLKKVVQPLITLKEIKNRYQNLIDVYQINGKLSADLESIKHSLGSFHKKINQKKFTHNPKCQFHINIDQIYDIIETKLERFPKLGDLFEPQNVFCGTPRAKDYHGWSRYIIDQKPEKKDYLKFVVCRNLTPFNINWGIPINAFKKSFKTPYFQFEKNAMTEKRWQNFRYVPKILIRGNDKRLTAVLDTEGYVFVGIYALIQKKYDPKYLIGLLNSELLNAYFYHMNPSIKVSGGYFSINSTQLFQLPIFPASDKESVSISELVSKIIEKKKQLNSQDKKNQIKITTQLKNIIKQLNDKIFQFYGLNENEIEKIKSFVRDCGIQNF
ncbi:MAG: Eco57I restriction-modification methylase domain-containing protein, partial [Candidatus Helarchaeota archaeon]